jgi:hypothetical protein
MKLFAIAASIALVLFGMPVVAQDTSDADTFAKALVGNTLLGKTQKGQDYAVYYREDGTMTFNLITGWSDTGTWRIEGGKFCQEWQQIRGGADYCIRDIETDGATWSYYNELINDRQSVEVKPGMVSIY